MSTGVVYVVTPVPDSYDLTSARQYGTIRHINSRYIYGDELNGETIPLAFHRSLLRAAEEFNPAADFLLMGPVDHIQQAVFTAMLGATHERFRALRWDRLAKGYLPIMVSTS